ncbi:hypothetical protein [Streptomyces sp. NPDC008092]|uniref:hypothetical protein n=1 Tax=Streptomyces sp. NPDC008092 TaxID=3364808 RepID=UPI0036F12D64
MATRTRKTTAKKTATAAKKTTPARKPAAKKALPNTPPVNTDTVVNVRPPVLVRRKVFVGPMGVTEQAAIRAALAAAKAALRVPVSAWHGPVAHLADDTVLTHTPAHATTDQTPTFRAAIACPHGAIHLYTIHTAQELHRARLLTAQCDGCTIPTPDTETSPKPAVRALGDALTRARSATAETQPMSRDDIAAGLAARATDQAKEHPQP